MTTPLTQGATMTLPPCPIAGHDNPHHWHERKRKNKQIWHPDHRDGEPGIVCTKGGGLSRCYSAHVPELAEAAADEWVRVPHLTPLPPETPYRCWSYQTVSSIGWTPSVIAEVYVKRSDLDAILKPSPTPAEKLAEALTAADPDSAMWCAADVLAALDAAGLTLAERGEK